MSAATGPHLAVEEDFQWCLKEQLVCIYCMQSHVSERFSEISGDPDYHDICHELLAVIGVSNLAVNGLEQVFKKMEIRHDLGGLANLVELSDDLFMQVQLKSTHLPGRNLALLSYMQHIQNTNRSALTILRDIANVSREMPVCDLWHRRDAIRAAFDHLRTVLLLQLTVGDYQIS